MIVVITNKEKDFKEKIGKVIISGTVQFQYEEIPNKDNNFGVSDLYYNLNITSINIATYSINVSDEYDVTWNITIETFTSKTASTIT